MTESGCTCIYSALQVSDTLLRTEASLFSSSFDQVLNAARHASVVVRQYCHCAHCSDALYFTTYVVILRKAAVCYNHLANLSLRSPSTSSSPGRASNTSTSSGESSSYGGTSRLRIGNFEVDAPVDDYTRSVILRTEVRRAADAAAELDTVMGPGSVKAYRQWDQATLTYQRVVVANLQEEISAVERTLYTL